MKNRKNLLGMALALTMSLSVLPAGVLAAEEEPEEAVLVQEEPGAEESIPMDTEMDQDGGVFESIEYAFRSKSAELTSDTLDAAINIVSQEATVKTTSGKTGWEKINGCWAYFKDGVRQVGLVCCDGSWYYMDENGCMRTGWVQINGYWHYFNSDGTARNGWKSSGGCWYYLDVRGQAVTGWQTIDSARFYFSSSGVMQKGWKQIDGQWYYFKSSGAATRSSWIKSGGKWYWFDSDGKMATGRRQIDGKLYYFSESGVMQSSKS